MFEGAIFLQPPVSPVPGGIHNLGILGSHLKVVFRMIRFSTSMASLYIQNILRSAHTKILAAFVRTSTLFASVEQQP